LVIVPSMSNYHSMGRRFAIPAVILTLLASPADGLLRAQSEPRFPEVVLVEPQPDHGSFGDCSGIVIASQIVLTAAHCLSGKDFGAPTTLAARITIQNESGQPPRIVQAAGFYRSPGYHFVVSPRDTDLAAAQTAAHDWALLYFDEPLGVPAPLRIDQMLPAALRARLKETPLAVLNTPTYSGDRTIAVDLQAWLRETFHAGAGGDVDALVVALGYDHCANHDTPAACTGKGVRRSAPIRIANDARCGRTAFPPSEDFPVAVLCVTAVGVGHVPMTFADSGGPIYVRTRNGQWVLIGIVSINAAIGFSGSNAHLAASVLLFMNELEQQLQQSAHPQNAARFMEKR
jgi:hypothetical protein